MSEVTIRVIVEGSRGVEIDRDPAEARVREYGAVDYGKPGVFLKTATEAVAGKIKEDAENYPQRLIREQTERLRNYPPGTTLEDVEGEKSCSSKGPVIPGGMEKLELVLFNLSENISSLEKRTEPYCSPMVTGTGMNTCEKVHSKSKFAEGIDSLIELVTSLDNRIRTINERLEV